MMTQPTENDLARARTYLSGETYEPGAAPWSSDEKWIARAFVQERERIVAALRAHDGPSSVEWGWAADFIESGKL